MPVLNCITCKGCKKSYHVGINDKDIRKRPGSNEGFFAIGHDELDKIKKSIMKGDKIPCPNCGKECTVNNAKDVEVENAIKDPDHKNCHICNLPLVYKEGTFWKCPNCGKVVNRWWDKS